MMRKKSVFKIFLICLSIFSISCKAKTQKDEIIPVEVTPSTHKWYSFTKDGFENISTIQNAIGTIKKPWTEAVRIADAVSMPITVEGQAQNAFVAVNRLGILSFLDGKLTLHPDNTLYAHKTVSALIIQNGIPFVTLYKNTFFNDNPTDFDTFLLQFKTDSGISYPVLSLKNLNVPNDSEINDYVFDGNSWICSVKTQSDTQTSFSYISWQSSVPLQTISPVDASSKITIKNSTEEAFRSLKMPKDFSKAPARAQKLLSHIPESFGFSAECRTPASPKSMSFVHGIDEENTESSLISAKIQITDLWAAAIFEDGTMYFAGALSGKRILNNGKTIALRLPKLPENYVYSHFAISNGELLVSWEEQSFFETGSSGFLTVNLSKLLYNND